MKFLGAPGRIRTCKQFSALGEIRTRNLRFRKPALYPLRLQAHILPINDIVKQRYQYRAYPSIAQQDYAAKIFGCARVVFNDFVAERTRLFEAGQHRTASFSETEKKVITHAKLTPERAWLAEVPNVVLQQSVRDAAQAYRNFFDSVAKARKGRQVSPPRFKRRVGLQKVRFNGDKFRVRTTTHGVGFVKLSRMGWIRFVMHRPLPSEPSSVTLIREPDGTWYVSFVVDVPKKEPAPETGRVAGLDAGVGDDLLAVAYSDGSREKIANLRHYRTAQKRLAKAQRDLSRKEKSSKRREKAVLRVAKAHSKVSRTRLDAHRKLAARLVVENDVIAIEDLALSGMGRTKLAKSVYDAGIGSLYRLIHEKAESQGRTVVKAGRWEPTSQTCSVCGTPGGKKPLHIRVWECEGCGTVLDRDWNAATNIMVAAGLAETLNARGGSVRRVLASAEHAASGETRTHRTLPAA